MLKLNTDSARENRQGVDFVCPRIKGQDHKKNMNKTSFEWRGIHLRGGITLASAIIPYWRKFAATKKAPLMVLRGKFLYSVKRTGESVERARGREKSMSEGGF